MIVFAKERKISLDPKRNCTLSATAIQAKVNTTIQKVNSGLRAVPGFRVPWQGECLGRLRLSGFMFWVKLRRSRWFAINILPVFREMTYSSQTSNH